MRMLSLPWQLLYAGKSCMSLVGFHLTLFNFHSGVHKMAIPVMRSMFPEIVGAVNTHLSLLPRQRNMSFVVPTHQQDFQACHGCLSVITFYNPPLHTRARFASSCNTLASSSNPLVVSRSLHSLVASSEYFIIELPYCGAGSLWIFKQGIVCVYTLGRDKGKERKGKSLFSLIYQSFINDLKVLMFGGERYWFELKNK